jgi:hypothetical protein
VLHESNLTGLIEEVDVESLQPIDPAGFNLRNARPCVYVCVFSLVLFSLIIFVIVLILQISLGICIFFDSHG